MGFPRSGLHGSFEVYEDTSNLLKREGLDQIHTFVTQFQQNEDDVYAELTF